jgi:hypothetical protein
MRTWTAAVAAAVLGVPAAGSAVELADGLLNVNGSGEWAYLRTDHGTYPTSPVADDDGEWETAMFDLLLTARPSDRLTVVAQLGFHPEDVGLEWGFAEWRFDDLFRARAGKMKQPFGNYAEIQFIGTARPLYTLPTSIYGPAGLGATAVSGVGLTGDWTSRSGWGLAYDAYVGGVELPILEPYEVLLPAAGVAEELHVEHLENMVGGRLSLTTPGGIVLRLSGYGGTLTAQEGAEAGEDHVLVTSGLSLFYRGDKLWLSAEAFHAGEYGVEQQLAAYAEAAWFFTPKLQLAGRWEASRVTLDDFDGSSPLLRHDEVVLGVNYWLAPELVVKASVHGVRGHRFAAPATTPADPTTLSDGDTLLLVGGVQFTF